MHGRWSRKSGEPHEPQLSTTVMAAIRKISRFANLILPWIKGAAPTLMVLVVLVVLHVPPYADILTDLRGLLRLLIS